MGIKGLTILIISQALFFTASLKAAEPTKGAGVARVVFLSPDTSRFWHLVGGFMQVVAGDLELRFPLISRNLS